jgi:uncharacterized membrane protein
MRRAASVVELTKRNVETIAKIEKASESHRTFGERAADCFAAAVGSWTFLIIQTVIFALWVVLNLVAWVEHWDPYPFILLNLALSFQAAYASPIIMMSQNRQTRMAERRNQLDLQINLLAEQETTEILRLLRMLCEKQGIDAKQAEPTLAALEQQTRPERVLRQIDKMVEGKGGGHPPAAGRPSKDL